MCTIYFTFYALVIHQFYHVYTFLIFQRQVGTMQEMIIAWVMFIYNMFSTHVL